MIVKTSGSSRGRTITADTSCDVEPRVIEPVFWLLNVIAERGQPSGVVPGAALLTAQVVFFLVFKLAAGFLWRTIKNPVPGSRSSVLLFWITLLSDHFEIGRRAISARDGEAGEICYIKSR